MIDKFLNKLCQIKVDSNGTILSYTGTITEITKEHFCFTDKFSMEHMFLLKNIVEIRGEEK
jgi:hypothetical protein